MSAVVKQLIFRLAFPLFLICLTCVELIHCQTQNAESSPIYFYRAIHRFGESKIANDGLVLGLSQFSILPELPYKMMLDSKVVKNDSKIIISLP